MRINEYHEFKGVFRVELEPKVDERGFFMRTFDKEIFVDHGIQRNWCQENHSRSNKKGTIRGLHFQLPTFCETKLVRCLKGKIFDVFVDLRKNSDTFGKWGGTELSEENNLMIFIPRGFAHGFCTMSDMSDVEYKVDNVYSPQNECGIIWNDPDIGIHWPYNDPILSEKDRANMSFHKFVSKYNSIKVTD